tara:strand:+ start:299 stop:544 length:246 start_codon:yes stop_codon:yes gene_type:complete
MWKTCGKLLGNLKGEQKTVGALIKAIRLHDESENNDTKNLANCGGEVGSLRRYYRKQYYNGGSIHTTKSHQKPNEGVEKIR